QQPHARRRQDVQRGRGQRRQLGHAQEHQPGQAQGDRAALPGDAAVEEDRQPPQGEDAGDAAEQDELEEGGNGAERPGGERGEQQDEGFEGGADGGGEALPRGGDGGRGGSGRGHGKRLRKKSAASDNRRDDGRGRLGARPGAGA